jgi:hypothetical protein
MVDRADLAETLDDVAHLNGIAVLHRDPSVC